MRHIKHGVTINIKCTGYAAEIASPRAPRPPTALLTVVARITVLLAVILTDH